MELDLARETGAETGEDADRYAISMLFHGPTAWKWVPCSLPMRMGLESELWMKRTVFRWGRHDAGISGGYYRSWGRFCSHLTGLLWAIQDLQGGHVGGTLGRLCQGTCVLHDNCQPEVCILWGRTGMQTFFRVAIVLALQQLCEPEEHKGPCRCWESLGMTLQGNVVIRYWWLSLELWISFQTYLQPKLLQTGKLACSDLSWAWDEL